MKRIVIQIIVNVFIMIMIANQNVIAQDEIDKTNGYRIDQPGTITFTVGVKIKGKVERPQVIIFIPKEKPIYREILIEHSFKEDILKPLPFIPIVE